MLRPHKGGVMLFGVTPRGHGMRKEAREGASMNPKRRTRAVFFSALLVLACITAIPAPSEAFPIKWLFYPPAVGDPDYPTGGMYLVRFGMIEVRSLRVGGQLVLLVARTGSTECGYSQRVSGTR